MDYLGLTHAGTILNQYNNTPNAELELRMGKFINGFVSNIGLVAYQRVADFIQKREHQEVKSHDVISHDVRKTTVGNTTTYTRKVRVASYDSPSIGVRMSLSTEETVDATAFTDTDLVVRDKERLSTMLGGVRLDLTKVVQAGNTSYELELEHISGDVVTGLNEAYAMVFKIVYDTPLIYTLEQSSDLMEYVNRSLLDFNNPKTVSLFPLSEVRNKISYYPFPRPRNITLEDLKYKGIVGGKVTYSATYKTDGEHKLLVIAPNGVWFFNPPDSVSLLMNFNDSLLGLPGLILEGELVPPEKRRINSTAKYLFYVYDCLAMPGDNNTANIGIQHAPLNERMLAASTLVDIIRNEGLFENTGLEIKLKSYHALGVETDQFFTMMTYLLSNENSVEYETDGLIFTPNIGPYHPHSEAYPLDQRVLSAHPDIVKWKPVSKMTIDFYVVDMGSYYELYTHGRSGMELFTRHPRMEKISGVTAVPRVTAVSTASTPTITSVPSGTIVEVAFPQGEAVITRVRYDKTLPNSTDIANAVYKDILNPITEDMMQGKGFRLMRHYHNQIKKTLFDYVSEKLGPGAKVLLDLGSGRGGDISKWSEFDKIVAVEPSSEHIEELKRRLVTYGMQNRVIVVQARAQDTELIRQALLTHGISKVSCVSCMLAMTFLWESRETLDALCNTINSFLEDNGYFIYFVMDGTIVKQLFRPTFLTNTQGRVTLGHDYDLVDIDFQGAKIRWLGDRKIHVHIDESIVTDQEEYLVQLDDLNLRLGKMGFTEGVRQRADKERLLPFNEKGFSSLFTYGSFQKKASMTITDNYDLIPVASRIPYLNFEEDIAEGEGIPYFVTCDWYNGSMVAITTIGDGSCFFHAFSRIVNADYGNTTSLNVKLQIVTMLRQSIANVLDEINPSTGLKYYFSTLYPDFAVGDPFYSLSNIKNKIANTKEYVGDFIYSLIPQFLGVDLIVLEYRDGNLVPHADTLDDVHREIVCIVAYDSHFEPLVELRDGDYIMRFDRNSAFVQAYLRRKTLKTGRRR